MRISYVALVIASIRILVSMWLIHHGPTSQGYMVSRYLNWFPAAKKIDSSAHTSGVIRRVHVILPLRRTVKDSWHQIGQIIGLLYSLLYQCIVIYTRPWLLVFWRLGFLTYLHICIRLHFKITMSLKKW